MYAHTHIHTHPHTYTHNTHIHTHTHTRMHWHTHTYMCVVLIFLSRQSGPENFVLTCRLISVVLFHIGPLSPTTEDELSVSVGKPRPDPIFKGSLVDIRWWLLLKGASL